MSNNIYKHWKRRTKTETFKAVSLSALFLFFFLFFISFTSAVINVTILPPLEQPNLTLTRVPGGGSFTAGNYTFGIFSDASGSGAYGNAHLSYAGRVSNYTSATIELQANDAVMLNWTVDPKTASIFVYRKGTTSYLDWSALYSTGFRNTTYPTGVTLTTDGFAQRGGGLHTYEVDNFYFGMRPDKGMGQIKVNATQHFTTSDIMDAIRNSSMIEGEDYIDMGDNGIVTVYSLNLQDTSYIYNFYINNSLIYFTGGIYSAGGARIYSDNGLGTTILSSKQGGYGNSFNLGNVTLIDVAINPIRIYYSKGGFYYGQYSGQGYTFSGTKGHSFVNASYINSYYGGVEQEYYDSMVRTNTVNIQSATEIPTRQRTKTGYVQLYSDSQKNITNQEYILTNSYQLFQTGNGRYDNYFLDCIFNVEYNSMGIVPVPIIYVYNYAVDYGINTIHIGNTFNLKITNGSITNNISNANVLLYNKDNNLVFNKTTNINGSIEEQAIYFFEISNKPTTTNGIASTTNSNWTYYSPYNLIIEKEGYKTYNSTFNITKKIDWTIALEEETPSSGGDIVIYSSGDKLPQSKKYPYLNYEISNEKNTFSGLLTNPYIVGVKRT